MIFFDILIITNKESRNEKNFIFFNIIILLSCSDNQPNKCKRNSKKANAPILNGLGTIHLNFFRYRRCSKVFRSRLDYGICLNHGM